jgi:flavin reductase (DIM6/NTAB) family NADH-FMN oxidoreductase RutF
MKINPIDIDQFCTRSFSLWKDKWMLLTAGSRELKKFNCMTISWGSIGYMWNKPFAQVAVRPSRLTFQYISDYPDFTLCIFPEKYRQLLQNLGARSGREMDKINHSGFTPIPAKRVEAPAFEEAELVIECRKIFWQDFDADHFLDMTILSSYPQGDFHREFFGEILSIRGSQEYSLSV